MAKKPDPAFLKDADKVATIPDSVVQDVLQNWLTLNEFFKKTPNPLMTSNNLKRLLQVELVNGARQQMVEKLMGRLMTVRRMEEDADLRKAGVQIPSRSKKGRANKVIKLT